MTRNRSPVSGSIDEALLTKVMCNYREVFVWWEQTKPSWDWNASDQIWSLLDKIRDSVPPKVKARIKRPNRYTIVSTVEYIDSVKFALIDWLGKKRWNQYTIEIAIDQAKLIGERQRKYHVK